MMDTLQCVFKSNESHEINIWNKFCTNPFDTVLCTGVYANYTTGVYGTYSMCKESERYSWILNQLFISKGRDSRICTSSGGTLQSPVPPKSRSPGCEIFLHQAGTNATGKITTTPDPQLMSLSKVNKTLRTSSKVGIGLGIGLFAIILAIVALRLHARRKESRITNRKLSESTVFEKAELSNSSEKPISNPVVVELGSSEKHELEGAMAYEMGEEAKLEADSDAQIYELSSTGTELVELDGKHSAK
jgi:hypothetical protein